MKKNHVSKENGAGQTQPMQKKEAVPESNDEHIDEDFPGYPHHPSKENIVNPKTHRDKKTANTDKDSSDQDNGSAGAFEATENSRE
jgi:hypothetical protein